MFGLILVFHILVCVTLIAVVLVQSGKGGGLAGGAFGGSAQTVFGGRGATDFITRATIVLGGLFFVTSLTLAIMRNGQAANTRSLLQEEARRSAPMAPSGAPTAPSGNPGGATPGGTAPQTPAGGTQPAPATPPATTPTTPGGGR